MLLTLTPTFNHLQIQTPKSLDFERYISRSMARLAFGNVIKHAIRNRDGKGGRTLFAVFPVVAGLTGG